MIGIGYKPLGRWERGILLAADSIVASDRLHEVFKGYEDYPAVKERVVVITKIDETIRYIRDHIGKKTIVLLASGDPLFFGIGRRVLAEFGAARVEILPDLSSVQLAFARIKQGWDDAFLMSLHGGPDIEKRRRLPYQLGNIPSLLERHGKIAVLTDRENDPAAIASALVRSSHMRLTIYVCEQLGYPSERIISGSPSEIATMTFADPNVVVIMREAPQETGEVMPETDFGLREEEIAHSKGLITKDEVRAVSIHSLRLPCRGVLWDIGAGSGAVSIESSRLFPGLKIYAVERDEVQIANIRENIRRFGMTNVEVISGIAPDVLASLPSPDRVFIGGSGGSIGKIIEYVSGRMPRGRIVLNAVSLETVSEAISCLEKSGMEQEVSQVSVSRSKVIAGRRLMSALNPIFIIKGERA